MKTKHHKLKPKLKLPKITKNLNPVPIENFPLQHYSYSSLVKFSTNPIMFKINYINGDRIETTHAVSGITGRALHFALQQYYSARSSGENDPVKTGLEAGMNYLSEINDGLIEYSTTIETKQKALETLAHTFSYYMNDKKQSNETLLSCEELIEEDIQVEWRGQKLTLPVRLKGYIDKLVRDADGRIKIIDYKTVRNFSDPDKIDGAKILQAIQYYFLVYAKYGEEPYSMTYEEIKTTKNRDGSPQIREYEMVYGENELFFDFYFRLYDDVTRAINGEAVFVPNVYTMFDNEVSIIAYIHRLDVSEEAAKLMKKMRVESITELLKKKMHEAGNMRRLLKNAEKKFISAENLNYEAMNTHERIQTKLMEHGMMVQHDSTITGHTVDLYRFTPSIGLKMGKLLQYVADIEQVVGISGVRVLAPIPNTTYIGFEIPRKERTYPTLPEDHNTFNLAMGVDIEGNVFNFDIRNAPHMLVAGATGSGKSVFLNSIIHQLSRIPKVELYLFDPKIVELQQFQNQATQYLTDSDEIGISILQLVDEMNERYALLKEYGARNIMEYTGSAMPYKFVVIDEYGDLVISRGIKSDVTYGIQLLAQKARACGIHLIIATQRPSTDIITGSIKANFPTKVAFRTAKAVDSQVLLDEAGAEKLLGRGDMLFSSDFGMVRLQGFNY